MNDPKTPLAKLEIRIAEQDKVLGQVLATFERAGPARVDVPTHLIQSLEEATDRARPAPPSPIPNWTQRA
jgi:hypothetical protein